MCEWEGVGRQECLPCMLIRLNILALGLGSTHTVHVSLHVILLERACTIHTLALDF